MTNNNNNSNCVTSRKLMSSQLMLIFGVLLLVSCVISSPVAPRETRYKRSGISDQRLAELETLAALSSMRGRVVTMPVAYGIIDPARIGKRKRSYDHSAVSEDVGSLLERLMRRVGLRSEVSDSRDVMEDDVAQMMAEA